MPTVDIDRDAAHDAAQQELDKPIYPKGSLSEQFSDWINELIYRLAQEGAGVPGGWLTLSVLGLLAVALFVLAVRVARRTMRTDRGDSPLYGGQELGAAQHRAIAAQHAAAGEWELAIRHRLRAVARRLEETGMLPPVPGRTATELARDAGSVLPHLSAQLRDAATAFNDVTYGDRPGTEAAYRLVAGLDDQLSHGGSAPGAVPGAQAPAAGWAEVR